MYFEARELVFKSQLDQFCDLLNRESVPFLIFKGSALAYSIYKDPVERPRLDTDVLIPLELRSRVENILVNHGYDSIPNQSSLLGQTSYIKKIHQMTFIFDIHWQLFAPIALKNILSFTELWSERKKIPNLNAYSIDDSSALILAGVHWVGHHLLNPEPHWITDIQLLTKDRSQMWWIAFKKKCQIKGVQRILDQVLRSSNVASPWTSMEIENISEPLSYYLNFKRTTLSDCFMDLKFLKGKERLFYLKSHLFPDFEFMQKSHGASSRNNSMIFFYFKRIFKGLRRIVKPRSQTFSL
ncbi:nucleotidyltransferase family protein [bacterium]|nr:nucleotidyltransferase family protein [bacterium]